MIFLPACFSLNFLLFINNIALLYKNGDFIRDGFDEELDRLRSIKENASSLLYKMEQEEKEKTLVKNNL